MLYNFPEVLTSRTVEERLQKVLDEIEEFKEAENGDKLIEAIDILHSTESLIRGIFKNREEELNKLIRLVTAKNKARGYYDSICF